MPNMLLISAVPLSPAVSLPVVSFPVVSAAPVVLSVVPAAFVVSVVPAVFVVSVPPVVVPCVAFVVLLPDEVSLVM